MMMMIIRVFHGSSGVGSREERLFKNSSHLHENRVISQFASFETVKFALIQIYISNLKQFETEPNIRVGYKQKCKTWTKWLINPHLSCVAPISKRSRNSATSLSSFYKLNGINKMYQ